MDYDCGLDTDGSALTGQLVIGDGESASVLGIPTGNTCSVTEVAPTPIPDWTWGTITYTPASIIIDDETGTFEIVVGNSITRDRGSLTIVKKVINDDGGTATVSDFSITTSAGSLTFDSGVPAGTTTTYTSQKITVVTGDYTLQEIDVDGYTEGTWSCVNGTANPAGYNNGSVYVGKDKDVVCTINNDDIAPTLKLVKTVDNGAYPGGTLGPNDWLLSAIRISGEGDATRDFDYAGGSDLFVTVFANAGYDLSESTEDGYQIKTDWSCDGGTLVDGVITLDLDEDVTCTIVNEALGQVDLTKLTQGTLYYEGNEDWGSMTWDFTLKGPGVDATDSAPPSEVDFGGVYLIPGEEYTLCEVGIAPGWTLEWKGDNGQGGEPDTIIPMVSGVNNDPVDATTGYSRVYDPNYEPPPAVYSNDERCVNFVVGVGQTRQFSIDNQYPGGEPRTIGFWKNWNTCTGGGQADTAAANGGPEAGWYILDDLLNYPGYTIGILELDGEDCEIAVEVLDKSDYVTGKSMANDAAYNMAAQLLGAQLNLSAGAETCPEIVAAVNEGQALLALIGFEGTGGPYLRPNGQNKDLYYYANDLAAILDTYNNGNLCGEGGEEPPLPDDGYLHVSALSGEGTPGKRDRWTATWTVEVQDQDSNLMEGATVSGVLSDGATGGANCTTDSTGTCTITKANLKESVTSVTFTITGVSLGDYIYDPDGLFGPANSESELTINYP
jgi:hypothetical protein